MMKMMDPEELLSEARGFQRSRVILTAVELDCFTRLDEAPASSGNLAKAMGLDARATTRLLDCLVTFGLLAKKEGRYQTTERSRLLSSRHPETVRPMVLHMSHLWHNWSHLTETVRQGTNPERRGVTEARGETLGSFIGAMHVVGKALSTEIAAAYDAGRFRCLLDIGGGSGTYTIAFLERNPRLHAVLFDLPEVVAMAQERLAEQKLSDRVRLVSGDFYQDDLPTGCDLALLSAIIHQNSTGENLELFRKIHRALTPEGVLLIRDHVMDEERLHPASGVLFALNMLVATLGGDTYTFSEVEKTLSEAGFREVKLVRRGEKMDGLIEAQKPV